MVYNESENKRIGAAWEKFINGEPADFSFLRPEIYESWIRSKGYNVNPYLTKTAILKENELNVRINRNLKLMEIVRPYIENLYSIVKNSGYYILFSDNEGYILDILGDKDIIETGRKSMLIVGANRNERFAGSNAVGTCLALNCPVQMVGEEHYVKPHKRYVCSGAPIKDQAGNPVAALVMTGMKEAAHVHTLGMVMSAVDGISKELKILNAYEEIEMISAQRNSIIETIPSGVLLLNENNRVIQINANALSMMGKQYPDMIGRNFLEFLNPEDSPEGISNGILGKESYNSETDVYIGGSHGAPLKLNMSVHFVTDNLGRRKGTVIRFNETKRINALVTRIGGYKPVYTFESIKGDSEKTKEMIETARKAAKNDSNVLILGESGTGKELVAQAVHNASAFAKGPFIALNCGALPKGLIESELFGYEKGAFTGANKEGNPGKFELADGGTIFLDEIGDMPFDIQAALLRVLQTKEVIRIGAKYPKKINVRVIAATNRNLKTAIDDKTFRQDLYYRLNVLSVHVPPLRERGEDVILLAGEFVEVYNKNKGTDFRIAGDVLPLLREYSWPGNIRELENIMERAINVADGTEITPAHLPSYIMEQKGKAGERGGRPEPGDPERRASFAGRENSGRAEPFQRRDLAEASRELIFETLRETRGNIKKASELLGISRRTLYRKMDLYEIDSRQFKYK